MEIIDRYRIISTLSTHPHSTVWLAEHKSLGVKRIIKGIPKNAPGYGQLVREAHLMKNLKSPNIPAVYDVEEDENFSYIIEQYIEGESLGALCKHRLLSEKEVIHFAIRISSIIEYLHSQPGGIIYLDLKPENIIVSGDEVWLVDFGSAVNSADGGEQTGYASRSFCAPEQENGARVDFSTDIYAIGKLLEFMVLHSNVSETVSRKLTKIIERCGMRVPWMRIKSADTLKKMLENICDGETKRNRKHAGRDKVQGRRIGILGLSPGNGATHISIALANYLADTEYRSVCLIEQNEHSDMGVFLDDVTDGSCNIREPVKVNGVTYLTNNTERRQEYLLNRSFDCIVFDLGSNRQKAMSTLQLCDIRILVAGAAPWRRKELDFLTRLKSTEGGLKGWILLVNLADDRDLRDWANPGIPILSFPPETSPMNPQKGTVRTFDRAMR